MEFFAIMFWIFFVLTILFIGLGSYFIDTGSKDRHNDLTKEDPLNPDVRMKVNVGIGCIVAGIVCLVITYASAKACVP